jgi:hypothetical protein
MIYRTNTIQFNTKTSIKIIARNTLRHPYKDSETYFEADLYKSRRGEYFLYGKGGLLSVFKGQKEERILPLKKEEAQLIAKEFMRSETYQKEFSK